MEDYFALIPMGAGGSWGRGPTREAAVKEVLRNLRDWDQIYKVDDVTVTINIVEVTGYGTVDWDVFGLHGVNEATGKRELINRPFKGVETYVPKRRKRK
jgi:hypothetical protein